MQALLLKHYAEGGSYPVGGSSEIALQILPVIERAGGAVLTRANVVAIQHNGRRVCGVRVQKGGAEYEVKAPIVISSAGVYNTFLKLLPKVVAQRSYFTGLCRDLKPALAMMSVFVGLDASGEELDLRKHNVWAFSGDEAGQVFKEYLDKSKEEVMDAELPLVFISFPSAKDPAWSRHPGRASKSTCAVITLANWSWYEKFATTETGRRGDEYEELKKAVGDIAVKQACQLFPQIERHIDYVEVR